MVFSSMMFLFVFLPAVLLLYYLLPAKLQNTVFLLASLFFYAWGEPVYILLMLLSIAVNFGFGRVIGEDVQMQSPYAKINLGVAVGWNLLTLGIFKYYGFLSENINGWLPGSFLPKLSLMLPIGISFYTFQAISYLVDVYRGDVAPQKKLSSFALYIAMFPQLIAGPIVRYIDVEQQLAKRKVNLASFGIGCEFFLKGLVKKLLLANQLGLMFVQIQELPAGNQSAVTAWIGALAYTLQIYFDFSGYSDMAVGLGRMFGFRFPKNFDYPYIASSVSEFWRRWHISLSTWFREYVYIPLGGSRVSRAKHIRNIFIVWMLTGIWHGAGWNFLLWGLYYAVLLLIDKYILDAFLQRHVIFGRIMTFVAVMIGWMLFANTEISGMLSYIGAMFAVGNIGFSNATTLYFLTTGFGMLLLGCLFTTPIPHRISDRLLLHHPRVSVCLRTVLFLFCIAALVYQSYNPFLYFRF